MQIQDQFVSIFLHEPTPKNEFQGKGWDCQRKSCSSFFKHKDIISIGIVNLGTAFDVI